MKTYKKMKVKNKMKKINSIETIKKYIYKQMQMNIKSKFKIKIRIK